MNEKCTFSASFECTLKIKNRSMSYTFFVMQLSIGGVVAGLQLSTGGAVAGLQGLSTGEAVAGLHIHGYIFVAG